MAIIDYLLDDEGLAYVVGQQRTMEVDGRDDLGSEVDYIPLTSVVRTESMESGVTKRPGGRFKHRAQKTKACKRKRTWPAAGSKSAESGCDDSDGEVDYVPVEAVRTDGMESEQTKPRGVRFKLGIHKPKIQKRKRRWPAVGSKSAKSDEDSNFVPTKKRGRPAGSKSSKSKMGRKAAWSQRHKDDDFDPMVPTLKRALDVQKKLLGEYPSFTKVMSMSHVVEHFWLCLPSDFCKSHLPDHNASFTLEDELGQSCTVNYLGGKNKGLSGGWVSFAKNHSLKVGDATVFQLVEPTKFKVYIIRENELSTTGDDVKSKEDPEVTRASSPAPQNDANNLATEEAVDDVDDMNSGCVARNISA